jgi:hypothetical protein
MWYGGIPPLSTNGCTLLRRGGVVDQRRQYLPTWAAANSVCATSAVVNPEMPSTPT